MMRSLGIKGVHAEVALTFAAIESDWAKTAGYATQLIKLNRAAPCLGLSPCSHERRGSAAPLPLCVRVGKQIYHVEIHSDRADPIQTPT
jgi:hypothetical protein